eukprot:11212139-Lingulodinium_polyedra.AAC.1
MAAPQPAPPRAAAACGRRCGRDAGRARAPGCPSAPGAGGQQPTGQQRRPAGQRQSGQGHGAANLLCG